MKLYKNLKQALQNPMEVEFLKISISDKYLPHELFDFPHLKDLFLEADNLEEIQIEASAWKELKVLIIKASQFKGEIQSLFHLPSLENLKLIATPLKRITLPMGAPTSPLFYLTFKDCDLTDLPLEFGELDELIELSLPENKLKTLPPSFIDLKNLKRLNLDHNEFEIFPDLIKSLSKLKHLSIDGNHFNDSEKARIQREYYLTIK